jgi:3-phosphoshikimate 1-carboxyvinyltransferase
VFREVGELRVKESNRLTAIIDGLTTLGFTAWEEGDDLFVKGRDVTGGEPGPPPAPRLSLTTLISHSDHRLAMTWLVAARAFALDLDIEGLESVGVSYPGFLHDLEALS